MESTFDATKRDEEPIFIFGQARSGSTLLQRLINSTGHAVLTGEHLGLLDGIAASYRSVAIHPQRFELFKTTTDHEGFRQATLSHLLEPDRFIAITNGLTVESLQHVFRNFIKQIANPLKHNLRWGFKEIRYGTSHDTVLEMLLDLFPKSKFILLVRSPFHQVRSRLAVGWWGHDIDEAIATWKAQTLSFRAYSRTFPYATKILRYEDLVDAEWTGRSELFSWIGLMFTEVQRRLLFQCEKVGATEAAPPLPPEVHQRIQSECLGDELASLYPKE